MLYFSTFKMPPPADAVLQQQLKAFEQTHPGLRIERTVLPNSSDQQHQHYVIELGAGSDRLDLLAADGIWIAEFARAGWLAPLEAEPADFLAGPGEACRWQQRFYALPWFVDGGLLYYRRDLLARYGFEAPRTYAEMHRQIRTVLAGESNPRLGGFVWQGRQYEGLVCNFLEFLWGSGGEVLDARGRLALNRPALDALTEMRGLIADGLSPATVTSFDEEASRHAFEAGQAVFMRNWPYAWELSQQGPLRGKVGVAPLPHRPGVSPAATLGGWNLAVSAASPRRRLAAELAAWLDRPAIQRQLLASGGFFPTREALYHEPKLQAAHPALARFAPMLRATRARPVSPYYPQISATLQSEVSAVLARLRTPAEALQRMRAQIGFVLE